MLIYENNIWKNLPIGVLMLFFLIRFCTNPLNTVQTELALWVLNYFLSYVGEIQFPFSMTFTENSPTFLKRRTDHKPSEIFFHKTGYIAFEFNQKTPTFPSTFCFSLVKIIQIYTLKWFTQVVPQFVDTE